MNFKNKINRPKPWTTKEVKYLKSNYQAKGDVQLAAELNRMPKPSRLFTRDHISKKRKLLRLTRSPEELKIIRSAHAKNGVYNTVCKRWQTTGVAKENEIRIHNFNGIRRRVIKINGTFINYARYYYQTFIAPIPPGHVVTHKNGNVLDDSPGNLQTIPRGKLSSQNSKNRYKKPSGNKIFDVKEYNKSLLF